MRALRRSAPGALALSLLAPALHAGVGSTGSLPGGGAEALGSPAPGEWQRSPIGARAEAGPEGPVYSEQESPDARLADRVARRLSWDRELARFTFDVRVEQGIATLSGTVATQPQAQRARRIADRTLGVNGVVNNVRSAPKLEIGGAGELPTVDDETLRERVLVTLQDHPEIDARGVQVAVDDGRVTLEGRIPGLNQRGRAERLALGLRGVESVDNRLRATEAFRTGD